MEDYSDKTERDEFLQKFFPEGFPKCTSVVEKIEKSDYTDRIYSNHYIYIGGQKIARLFKEQSVPAEEVLERINSFSK